MILSVNNTCGINPGYVWGCVLGKERLYGSYAVNLDTNRQLNRVMIEISYIMLYPLDSRNYRFVVHPDFVESSNFIQFPAEISFKNQGSPSGQGLHDFHAASNPVVSTKGRWLARLGAALGLGPKKLTIYSYRKLVQITSSTVIYMI